jgi:hypothetical protein
MVTRGVSPRKKRPRDVPTIRFAISAPTADAELAGSSLRLRPVIRVFF